MSNLMQAFEEFSAWRAQHQAASRDRVDALRQRERELEGRIDALREELRQLREERVQAESRLDRLQHEETTQARAALLHGIQAEAALLSGRKEWLDAALGADLQPGARIRLIQQASRLQALSGIDEMPPGYRRALLARSQDVRRRLQRIQDDRPPLGAVTVVTAVELQDLLPRALVTVLPVSHDVYLRWNQRGPDLCTMLAWRVVGALSGTLADVGVFEGVFRYVPFSGKLAIQVWLGEEQPTGDLRQAWEGRFAQLCEQATELSLARLDLHAVWVHPGLLAPPEAEPHAS